MPRLSEHKWNCKPKTRKGYINCPITLNQQWYPKQCAVMAVGHAMACVDPQLHQCNEEYFMHTFRDLLKYEVGGEGVAKLEELIHHLPWLGYKIRELHSVKDITNSIESGNPVVYGDVMGAEIDGWDFIETDSKQQIRHAVCLNGFEDGLWFLAGTIHALDSRAEVVRVGHGRVKICERELKKMMKDGFKAWEVAR